MSEATVGINTDGKLSTAVRRPPSVQLCLSVHLRSSVSCYFGRITRAQLHTVAACVVSQLAARRISRNATQDTSVKLC